MLGCVNKMKQKRTLINRQTWNYCIRGLKRFAASEAAGAKAKWFACLLVLFLFGINGLNVVNSYVGRDFMTAIEDRNRAEFMLQALLYLFVFAASTVAATLFRFTEERLGLLWREWATGQSIISYADNRVYYRLKMTGELENPDQRIAEDIKAYTTTTISFVLMLLNASFTAIAFSGVLWSISPKLFCVAVAYAATGSLLTYLLGRPLVRLNFDQFDKEAKFRASLIHLRENAEAVSLTRREGRLIRMLLRNLADLTGNFRRIISVNRNVNFFANGYNWLIQIIPALIVAPLFIDGRVQFGVITQSAIAFTQLLGAFSLIISQFQNISSFTAVLARLSSLVDESERGRAAEMATRDFIKDENRVAYNGLTLLEPRSGKVLLRELYLDIPHGRHMLVVGPDETVRMALFRATAGLWNVSTGQIIRPRLEQLLFITERPYLPPGTFRELFMRPWAEEVHPSERNPVDNEFPEGKIMEALRELGLEALPGRFGGMDTPQTWESLLTLGEQQLLAIARVLVARPRFVFLDKPSTTLSTEQADWIFGLFEKNAVSYVTFEEKEVALDRYGSVLELGIGGMWDCKPIRGGVIEEEADSLAG